MTSETMAALADRVEALTGPCRETDAEIAIAAAGFRRTSKSVLSKGQWDYACEGDSYFIAWPAYTASLDAAMTLIPNGYEWSVNRCGNSVANVNRVDVDYPVHCGYAATPALALTAAALRARAAMEDTQ